MKFIFLFVIFAPFLGCSFANQTNGKVSAKTNIVKVQAGRMGHKPWMPEASYSTQVTLFNAIFTPLVRVNRFYEVSPGIFTSWNWNAEESQYEFTVDESLRFDDSRPLTLKDIEFAFVKTMLSANDNAIKIRFNEILGSEEIGKKTKFKSGACKGIILQEPNKFIIKLKRSNPLFIFKLSELMNPVAPIEDFMDDMVTFKKLPRGTGDYEITWSDPNSTLIRLGLKKGIEAGSRPKIVEIYSHGTALEHDVDISMGVSNGTIRDDKAYRRITGDFAKAMNVLDFNYNNNLSKSYYFRKAVSLAINREELKTIYDYADSTDEITLPEYFGHRGMKFDYSPELSRTIIEKHFKNIFSKEKPLKAIYHGPLSLSEKKKYVLMLEKQLGDVGIYVDFKPFEVATFEKGKGYDDVVFAVYGLATSFVDPLEAFGNYQPGSAITNNFDKEDRKASELFNEAKNAVTREQMSKAIKSLTAHYQEQYTFLPLMKFAPRFLVKKNKIKSIGIEKVQYALDLNFVELANGE